jgi:hypothetical protein
MIRKIEARCGEILILLVLAGMLLVGCGGDPATQQGENQAVDESTSSEPESTSEATSSETDHPALQRETRPTAEEVLEAFQAAGLSAPEPRDNTPQSCPDLECTQLITTETVSIYQWPDEETATSIQREYDFGDYQAGAIILRANESNVDIQPYAQVLDQRLTGSQYSG